MTRVSCHVAGVLLLLAAAVGSPAAAAAGNVAGAQRAGGENGRADAAPPRDTSTNQAVVTNRSAQPPEQPVDLQTSNKVESARTGGSVFGDTALLIAVAVIMLLLFGSGLLFWRMRTLDNQIAKLEADNQRLRRAAQQTPPIADPARYDDREAKPVYQSDHALFGDRPATPPPARAPAASAAREPVMRAAPSPPRPRDPAAALDPLRDELARLIASPGMRMAEYDTLLRRFGTLHGYEVTASDGSGRLVSEETGGTRRLCAIIVPESDFVAIFPSARFVRDFELTYKETLEAGPDVKAVFDLEADGSAALRIAQFGSARLSDGAVTGVARGLLSGFLR